MLKSDIIFKGDFPRKEMVQIRKIETLGESEKRQKRNSLIMSVLMISILLFSTAGYFTLNLGEDSSTSAGEVQDVGDGWVFSYGDQTLKVLSPPESVENVSILLSKRIDDYSGGIVYVASDNPAGYYEIASTLGRYAGRMQEACYGDCDKDLPEKNCNETMIVIKMDIDEGLRGKIYEGDNCVFIEGNLNAVDAFIYRIFEIA